MPEVFPRDDIDLLIAPPKGGGSGINLVSLLGTDGDRHIPRDYRV